MKKLVFGLLIVAGLVCAVAAAPDSHREAARELYRMMSPRETFISGFSTVFKAQLEQMAKMGIEDSKIKRIEKASVAFAEKIADDPELEKRMVSIYVEAFSEQEIQELIRFYRTPIGRKALRKLPELFQKGAQVGQELALKHQPQFQKEVQSILGEDSSN
jgi:hypothetical protein